MLSRQPITLLSFRLRSILILTVFAALFVQYVVAPECRRSAIIDVLHKRDALRAPYMFGCIGLNGGEPIPEPTWFVTRQQLAKVCGIKTAPWYGAWRIEFRPNESAAIRELPNSCPDLRILLTRYESLPNRFE
jgi:hypothetical protein